jgi:hypothetical protein
MGHTFKMSGDKPKIIDGSSEAADETGQLVDYYNRFSQMAIGSKEVTLGRSQPTKESNLGKPTSTLNSVFPSNKSTSRQYADTGESGKPMT